MSSTNAKPKRIAIALTGASGAPYFLRLIHRLEELDLRIHLLSSESGRLVLAHETETNWSKLDTPFEKCSEKDQTAQIASGSQMLDALVVIPCSMSTMSAIAYGFTQNLIHRVASVQLKEGRSLILVPRETPLSMVHLRAMTACKEAGAVLLPASPSFYNGAMSMDDLLDTVVDRVLDHINIDDQQIKRWRT